MFEGWQFKRNDHDFGPGRLSNSRGYVIADVPNAAGRLIVESQDLLKQVISADPEHHSWNRVRSGEIGVRRMRHPVTHEVAACQYATGIWVRVDLRQGGTCDTP